MAQTITGRQATVAFVGRQLGLHSRVDLWGDDAASVAHTALFGTYAAITAANGFNYVTASDRQVSGLLRDTLRRARHYRARANVGA
jgi:hypothetical protein